MLNFITVKVEKRAVIYNIYGLCRNIFKDNFVCSIT